MDILILYSYCDFSHLYRILAELTSFSDLMPYGQLVSRLTGTLLSDGWTAIPCIQKGIQGTDNYDFYDVGKCLGQLSSQILDATF